MVPVQQHKHMTEELSECLGKCPKANLVASHCTGWLSNSLAGPVKQLQPGCSSQLTVLLRGLADYGARTAFVSVHAFKHLLEPLDFIS
jgi:hypothetical protein